MDPSRFREMMKFVRRHRVVVAVASVVLVTLAAGATQSRLGFMRARRAQHEAERDAAVARAVSGFLTQMLTSARPDPARGDTVTVRDVLDAAAARLESERPYAHNPEIASAVRLAIGEAYQAIGAYDAALPVVERAVGKVHVAYTNALAGAATMHAEAGDLEQAETLLREALELERELYRGADESQLAYTLGHLASVLAERGRWDEAVAWRRESLDLLRRHMGDDSPAVALSMSDLGVVLDGAGRWTEAEPVLVDAWEMLAERLGAEHPRAKSAAEILAAHYEASGEPDLADAWRHRAGGVP
ncbi:MAG: tetratricopeptide repeat protein [Candidatus Krumholzibacteria bacterium]|nr:tetratricopeptide repeat protein [Candidatus Krumholzibacteria bacterium]